MMHKESDKGEFKQVVAEAKKFLNMAANLKAMEDLEEGASSYGMHPRETAAMKRSSMDLTRALTRWRQRNQWKG